GAWTGIRWKAGELITGAGYGQGGQAAKRGAFAALPGRETIMADNDDEAAVERVARRIFELQNPGKPWPGEAQAKTSEQERYQALAKRELGAKES
ncbi:MAG: hypothetical protein Q8S29_14300, partial [Phreatobacter sp.]|nr:hypothetical protein [Phreatobacter sp.]